MAFGDNLKRLRQEKGLRQKDLAEIIGVSSGAIGMYENNKRAPDFEILKKIAKYFQVSTDYLLDIVNDPDTVKLAEYTISKELYDINPDYLTIAKEMQDKGIPAKDIKKILDVLRKHT